MHTILIAGAALIGIPILLHLMMRQEPKKLPFPAFRFLKLRRRINQRKMRLRHLILLMLRMFLILLIALALFQPTIISDQFNIRGDSPIACIIVIDTSPSMGYVLSDRAGLTEARQRGLKMLDEPASGSWTALDDARYRALAKPVVEAFGGKYLARAGRTETLEGDWAPARLVILEFPSLEQVHRWLNSEEYREARELRHATASTQMVVIEAYDGVS